MDQSQNFITIHNSLPELNLNPHNFVKKHKKYRRSNIENDSLTYIVSAFYAKLLIILGIALPITDAIAIPGYDSYDGFYVYLYCGTIVFLLYVYLNRFRYTPEVERLLHPEIFGLKKRQYLYYGSIYFRIGVAGFGIGSIIYSGLQLGQYWDLRSENDCNNILRALKPACRILFAMMQMLFIFSYNNFLDVQRSKFMASFGLMHMIATNICEWLSVLVNETQYDIYKSAKRRQINDTITLSEMDSQFLQSNTYQITQKYFEYRTNCLKSKLMSRILNRIDNYLVPCKIEYSFLCSVILLLMWKNNWKNNEKPVLSRKISEEENSDNSDECKIKYNYSKKHSHYSVDCAQAQKGLFGGILVLAITIISLIMFFELVSLTEYKSAAILQVNIWESILFWLGTIAAILCHVALRDIEVEPMSSEMRLEHHLLLVTQCGVFMYFLFQIIGAILMGNHTANYGIARILTPVSALVQSSCQTVLVLDAWRRKCTRKSDMQKKPGRQLLTFLLVINISLWIVNRLKNNKAVSHPNQMDFYGILAWNLITHVTMPLVVSYRFQSTVCFYEIWKNVYKIRQYP